jgi:[calcium/calmodulin-dependent protein kinase] kinase
VIEEIGRGMHGKVKLARNLETGESVAIKIIPRFSKKRRLGKVTAMSPQDKTKKEIAILKKIRHPNVVALLEVIDDPELKKIYMVLEHAEYGEIVWRKKGLPHVCQYERRRVEREMHGGKHRTPEDERYEQILGQRQSLKERKRENMAQNFTGPTDYWSVEHGAADESVSSSKPHDDYGWESEEKETPGPLRSNPNSATHLEGTMYGAYMEDSYRGRRPSVADSIFSYMSSIDFFPQTHDSFADEFSYVPCFSMDQARAVFRNALLGLEYLHYQGVVHRDIKPANLLWCKGHRVKISDFGVSYFGRPIRDGELDETVSESEAKDFDDDLELAKTVGTPAFFAPELCYTDIHGEQHKVSEQIDMWSLGVTLYCLIFARVPFLAENEFQMFRKIATEEVYIPRRRLRPVDPATSPVTTSLYNGHAMHPFYRNDNDLAYEEIDDQLRDLLRQMLTKNPEHRIRLRDIKRHKWVIQGVQNLIGWLRAPAPAATRNVVPRTYGRDRAH